MQTLRAPALAFLLLVLAALTASAQTTPAVIPGQTVLAFDHDAADTTGYQLCLGSVCTPIVPAPAKDASANTFRFTTPSTLPRGPQVLTVRAVGEAGVSAPSDPVTFRVVVLPAKPGPVRAEAPAGGQ